MRIKKLFNFKYPKLMLLLGAIIASYFIFSNPEVSSFISDLGAFNYLGVFIAGLLFSFGFTSPFSAGYFIALNPEKIILAGIIGGFGAMLMDVLIFKFIRFSFKNEMNRLKKEAISRKIENILNKTLIGKLKIYIMYIFAGILIASPLPDEIGVIILAGLTKVKTTIIMILGFILNTLGIIILLSI
jgi:hypothetical protein